MQPLLHPQTKEQIDNLVRSPSHAVSIVGEAGAGKGFSAQYIASLLLGCSVDRLDSWPYFMTLRCAQETVGIEQIREAQLFLALAVPGELPIRRVLILENIESLGREAQNALLKTLEEAPKDTVIICTIARYDYVLPTLHSRMQQISLRPVSLELAAGYFGKNYNNPDIERAYFISGGNVGLMSALLSEQEQHPLTMAISQARKTLGQSRYERLLGVDRLAKDKDASSDVFLDALYRLLHASYKQSVLKGRPNTELSRSLQRLHLVEQAASDLENKVSEKLVLSRLLFSL